MSTAAERQGARHNSANLATGAGMAAGLVGIVASSCCVLPILLVGLGLGSVGAVLIPALAAARPFLLGVAVLAIVFAWIMHGRRLRACKLDAGCETANRSHAPIWLILASAIVALALIWQSGVEPLLLPLTR